MQRVRKSDVRITQVQEFNYLASMGTDFYVNSILIYGSECWKISSQIEKRHEVVNMWMYRRMILWTEHAPIEDVLKIAQTERRL